ncbi:MAG: M20/M25/M40 family metallo-hydrolase [bacterium]|nr:M20/M25/M40 family metallo-hydrolase [bacterium]MDE0287336.1 M20/M25/M40 family metallo-hydrolase [bacterium]MDE0439155.1 M20/M25/M40 family metallo-hydrolase [bacterium]
MFDDLVSAIEGLRPVMRADLEELVRIDSVSAAGFDPAPVRRCAVASAAQLEAAGLRGVRLLEVDGAHPAVYGEIARPVAGAPTVLLYAHYDVQPSGPEELWDTHPFDPVEAEGRLYGRGTADDKSGIIIHTGTVRAYGGRPPVGVKVLLEGEEEIGSVHLDQFLAAHRDLLAADAIVVADAGNWDVGVPALTTSLRGLIDCVIEVRTLEAGVHSGMWGGVFPDALSVLVRALAALHDDEGRVAVPGLARGGRPPVELDERSARQHAGVLAGVHAIGRGSITERLWLGPAVSILAIDAPPVAEPINQLVPVARAKVSLRLAPGDDPDRAMDALLAHLKAAVPWGAVVELLPGTTAHPVSLDSTGPSYDAFRAGFRAAYGIDPVDKGVGGSIPFVQAFSDAYPGADLLLTGASDPASYIHGPNESLDLGELHRSTLAEAVALREMAG